MTAHLAGVVLAAGAGTRLRPLTDLRPKALCPVGGVPLADLALARIEPLTGGGPAHLAVNAHHHADDVARWAGERVHLSLEHPQALGTAGALGLLRPWLAERDVLVTNADSYLPGGLAGFTDGWDGERCRLLCVPAGDGRRGDFDDLAYVGTCLLPWALVRDLAATPSGLYEVLWRSAAGRGALDLVTPASRDAVAIDCGRPSDYLAANLHASGGASVIGAGAVVQGRVEQCVVWDGAWVGPHESLHRVVRAGDRAHPVTVPA